MYIDKLVVINNEYPIFFYQLFIKEINDIYIVKININS